MESVSLRRYYPSARPEVMDSQALPKVLLRLSGQNNAGSESHPKAIISAWSELFQVSNMEALDVPRLMNRRSWTLFYDFFFSIRVCLSIWDRKTFAGNFKELDEV